MLTRLLGSESPLMRDLSALTLRLSGGGVMLFAHGLGKMSNYSEYSAGFADPLGVSPAISLGLAIFAEVFCSILVMLGAVTRLAVVPLIVTMGVANFIIHAADPWGKKELSFMYLVIYLAIFLLGPGKFSVDGLLLKSRN